MLPFSLEQFISVFADYNQAIWPMQIVAYGLGLAAVVSLARTGALANRMACFILAALWLWTGFAYHGLYFSRINAAATWFAIAFVIEGLWFAWAGFRNSFFFEPRRNLATFAGVFLVAYALVVYALVNGLTGHHYPEMPTFGVTPCPLTLFTLGFLLLARMPHPWGLWLIPLLWSLIGGSAAFLLHVPSDWLLLFGGMGALGIALLARKAQQRWPTGSSDG